MGCFVSETEFFSAFTISFGTYNSVPHLFITGDAAYYRTTPSGTLLRRKLYRAPCTDLKKFEACAHDDPLNSYGLNKYGFVRRDKSGAVYYVSSSAGPGHRGIGHRNLYVLWSSEKNPQDRTFDLTEAGFRGDVAKLLLKQFDTPSAMLDKGGETCILSADYALHPTLGGDSYLIMYRTLVIGTYEHSRKILRVFSGPASSIHRKKLKELLNHADSG